MFCILSTTTVAAPASTRGVAQEEAEATKKPVGRRTLRPHSNHVFTVVARVGRSPYSSLTRSHTDFSRGEWPFEFRHQLRSSRTKISWTSCTGSSFWPKFFINEAQGIARFPSPSVAFPRPNGRTPGRSQVTCPTRKSGDNKLEIVGRFPASRFFPVARTSLRASSSILILMIPYSRLAYASAYGATKRMG